MDICSIFNLPESIKCIGIRRNLLVQRLKCTVAPEEPDKCMYSLHTMIIPLLSLSLINLDMFYRGNVL